MDARSHYTHSATAANSNPPLAASLLKRYGRKIAAVLVSAAALSFASLPYADNATRTRRAGDFKFESRPLSWSDRAPHQMMRMVHPSLRKIDAWVSSVGASVALADLDGNGLPDEACSVDPRFDEVRITDAGRQQRFDSFAFPLRDIALPYDAGTMAPMGCLPGDFDEDGRIDLLVYFWGRTPIIFLQRHDMFGLSAFQPEELMPGSPLRWFTNAATRADLDGDGHGDLVVANYFLDGARILDWTDRGPAQAMQDSMTRAANGGGKHFFLWRAGPSSGATPDDARRVRFEQVVPDLPHDLGHRWTLAVAAADLDGDMLPEVYFANDFGPDALLRNISTRGTLRFEPIIASRDARTPTSKLLGRDSFKGMGADFGDVNRDGIPDIFVSNIADEYALLESHFLFMSRKPGAGERSTMPKYTDESEPLGLSRSGWAWDAKLDDFDNDGVLEAVQATGFLRGRHSRWPELQELATGNDQLVRDPRHWPQFRAGDDLSGDNTPAFFARHPDGRYYDIGPLVGLGVPWPSRGIAIADVDGDGRLDMAIANQWADSIMCANTAPNAGRFLGLHLVRALEPQAFAVRPGHPSRGDRTTLAVGASVQIWRGSTLIGAREVDAGNGHSGRRSGDLHFGLGVSAEPVRVVIRWRDRNGISQNRSVTMAPGWHTAILGDS